MFRSRIKLPRCFCAEDVLYADEMWETYHPQVFIDAQSFFAESFYELHMLCLDVHNGGYLFSRQVHGGKEAGREGVGRRGSMRHTAVIGVQR